MTQHREELDETAPAAPSFSDASLDEEFADELDPTSAPSYSHPDDEEDFSELFDEDELEHDQDAEWTPGDPIMDYTGTVAVWVDENGVLERAQMIKYWRERAKSASLSAMFQDVFDRINIEFPGEYDVQPQIREFDKTAKLDADLLRKINDLSAQLDERMAELDEADEGYSQWRGEPLTVRDSRGRVNLTLDKFGQPQSVEIDPRAVDELTGSQICRCVMDAYQRARARFQPPEFIAGERFEIAEKYLTLTAMITSAAGNGLTNLPDLPFDVNPDQAIQPATDQER